MPMGITVKVKKLNDSATLPKYMSYGASGLDVFANISYSTTIYPNSSVLIPTGLAFELQAGYELQVRPRSGLAAKHGITVLNTPGTIDSDYRGEVKVLLINLSAVPYEIKPNERIAQLVLAPVLKVNLVETDKISDTDRGEGGFGSSGK